MSDSVKLRLTALSQDRGAGWVLVASNLVPLGFVAAGLWQVVDLLLVYWLENLVIGFWNLARFAATRRGGWDRLGSAFFFVIHYGLFCVAHGAIVREMFGIAPLSKAALGAFSGLYGLVPTLHAGLWLPLACLFVSHGWSFCVHVVQHGEGREDKPDRIMMRPYGRVALLHVVVLASGFFVQEFGAAWIGGVLLVAIKTAIDLTLHLKNHAQRARQPR